MDDERRQYIEIVRSFLEDQVAPRAVCDELVSMGVDEDEARKLVRRAAAKMSHEGRMRSGGWKAAVGGAALMVLGFGACWAHAVYLQFVGGLLYIGLAAVGVIGLIVMVGGIARSVSGLRK